MNWNYNWQPHLGYIRLLDVTGVTCFIWAEASPSTATRNLSFGKVMKSISGKVFVMEDLEGLKYVEVDEIWDSQFPPSIFVGKLLATSSHIVPLCRGSLCNQVSVTKGHHAWLARPGDVLLCTSSIINHQIYISLCDLISPVLSKKTLAKASKSKFCQGNKVTL